MIKTPLNTVIGGAFWTPSDTALIGYKGNNVIPSTVEPMLVTPSDFNVAIISVSDLEIDWGDGTIQTVKSFDHSMFGFICNGYEHIYTDSYIDKTISIKHVDGESPIQFFFSDTIKVVQRWYSEGYQPSRFSDYELDSTFYGLGTYLESVPNIAPPKTTDLSSMFLNAIVFDQDISMWDTSNVTNMSSMFAGASAFNQDISSWDTSNVTDMTGMFSYAASFNQPLGNWDTSNVSQMGSMFYGCNVFNQPLGNWDTSNVSQMGSMFYNAIVFDQDINTWNVSNVTDMSSMFLNSGAFNQLLNTWDVSNVSDMSSMFEDASVFNQDLSQWCVSNITSEPTYFSLNSALTTEHKPVWGTCPRGENGSDGDDETVDMGLRADYSGTGWYKATDTGTVFSKDVPALEAHVFSDSPVEYVSVYTKEDAKLYGERAAVSNMTDMNNLFDGATEFNKDISSWDVSNVVSMEYMFRGASSFNQDISSWNVSKVTSMISMFNGTSAFNQPLNNWDVSNVNDMCYMFQGAAAFNQPLNNWDVSSVTIMDGMFIDASTFNQPIGSWDTSNVFAMVYMFNGASAFNQDLSNWCVPNITSEPEQFAVGSILASAHKPVWGTCPSDETSTFEISDLFENNEQGFWYDPNDLSTMFQDYEGTVPVTAVGQPVGFIADKSGRDNHVRQGNSAWRPILRKNATTGANYLEFDGIDDCLQTFSIDFTASDKMSLFMGVTKLSDSIQIIAEVSVNPTQYTRYGSFSVAAGAETEGDGYSTMARGTEAANSAMYARSFTYPAPDDAVLSIKHDISDSLSSIRRNGVNGVDGTGNKGTGNFRTHALYIGRRAASSFAFNGHIYGLVGVSKLLTDDEVKNIEKGFAKQVGVAL